MKKKILLLCLLLLLLFVIIGTSYAQISEPDSVYKWIVAIKKAGLNIRKGPGTDCQIVGQTEKNQVIDLVGRATKSRNKWLPQDKWIPVLYKAAPNFPLSWIFYNSRYTEIRLQKIKNPLIPKRR